MAKLIPDCRLVTIDAGHLVHETRPAEFAAEFAAEVGAFLS
jgi:3-oxoadipate enol-lactonase